METNVIARTENDKTLARILVVEDEKIIALDLANTLVEFGYAVVATVGTGEAAIQAARELRPNIVLMDIRLPGAVDGVKAADAIRSESSIPVIYLTAHSDEETLDRVKKTEPFAYLMKPFRGPELRSAIEIALHRHEISKRLLEREQWLETTLRSIGDGVVATDENQKVTLLNPVAEALTGWKHEEALGRALDEILSLVSEKDRARIESPVSRALREKGATTLQDDALLLAKSGNAIPIDDSAAPILGDYGQVIGGVMIFRDVTERRRTEEEILRLNVELEHRVVERTQQLEAAYKEMESFSYSVAHDLRAPLRGIDGFSQILLEDHAANLGTEALEHLRRVRGAAERMGQIIDDLLSLSRAAMTEVHRSRVNLSRIARSVTEALQAAHGERSVELVIQEAVFVEGDEHLLRIVLENLIGNAWKFTSKTTQARIEFGCFEKEGLRTCFVRDNGVGFNEAHAHRMFGAFQRLHSSNEFEGTGIGLAIVQRIINRHGGRIWAESTVDHGATFLFVV